MGSVRRVGVRGKKNVEEIARRRPIDSVAARVTSRGPKGYELAKKFVDVTEPPKLRPLSKTHLNNAAFQDLTGQTQGWLTVIGGFAHQLLQAQLLLGSRKGFWAGHRGQRGKRGRDA